MGGDGRTSTVQEIIDVDATTNAFNWIVFKDTTDGKKYKIQVTNGVIETDRGRQMSFAHRWKEKIWNPIIANIESAFWGRTKAGGTIFSEHRAKAGQASEASDSEQSR